MLEKSLRDIYLTDELQLGQRLNTALQGGHRAEFALLLSMISPDVTDAPLAADKPRPEKLSEDLRARFELPPPCENYASKDDFARGDELTDLFEAGGQRAVFLAQCLRPAPLVPVKRDLAPEVYNDLPPLKQEKVRRAFAGESIAREALPGSLGGFEILGEIAESKQALA